MPEVRYHGVIFTLVWAGEHRHVTLSGDYARYPDQLSAAAPERAHARPAPAPVEGRPRRLCACGCQKPIPWDRRYARGHHPHGARIRGRPISLARR